MNLLARSELDAPGHRPGEEAPGDDADVQEEQPGLPGHLSERLHVLEDQDEEHQADQRGDEAPSRCPSTACLYWARMSRSARVKMTSPRPKSRRADAQEVGSVLVEQSSGGSSGTSDTSVTTSRLAAILLGTGGSAYG